LFTYVLMEGLDGAADKMNIDGKVSITELLAYVSTRVVSLTNHRQTPTFSTPRGLSDFMVAMK
jgi:uncharacterized caspase-like protein